MSRNRLAYFINGREAIPVRAIPFVTGWMQSPDEIAGDLSMHVSPPFSVLREIKTYHVHGAAVTEVLPKEWDAVLTRLKALQAQLRKTYSENDEGYAAWREESPKILPAGVFLWRDEFENELERRKSEGEVTLHRERSGDLALNYEPMIAPNVWADVISGFEPFQYERQESEKDASGRYTLEEAAVVIAEAGGESRQSVLKRIRSAAFSGELPTYNPGKQLRVTYGAEPGQNDCVRDFYEEVYWKDVNTWLDAYESRITFRFPAPRTKGHEATRKPDDRDSPLGRQAWQEREILRVIETLGYNALALPPNERGKSGVKSEVYGKCLAANSSRWIGRIFDKAWERLKQQKRISYANK